MWRISNQSYLFFLCVTHLYKRKSISFFSKIVLVMGQQFSNRLIETILHQRNYKHMHIYQLSWYVPIRLSKKVLSWKQSFSSSRSIKKRFELFERHVSSFMWRITGPKFFRSMLLIMPLNRWSRSVFFFLTYSLSAFWIGWWNYPKRSGLTWRSIRCSITKP